MINPRQIIQESSDAMSECIACISRRRRRTGRHAAGPQRVTLHTANETTDGSLAFWDKQERSPSDRLWAEAKTIQGCRSIKDERPNPHPDEAKRVGRRGLEHFLKKIIYSCNGE
jgi:hypothetical protein